MKNRRTVWGLAILLVLLALAGGVYLQRRHVPQVQSISVAAILPLTGPLSSYGVSEQQGMTLAAEEVNSAGGVGGKQLKLTFEDSRGQASDAVAAAQKALTVSNIRFLFTSLTGPTRAVAPVADKAGALHIVFAMDEAIPQGYSRMVRIYPGIKEEGRMLLAYARLVKPRHVGIIQLRHVAYDSQVRDVLVPGLREAGAASVTVETFDGSDLPSVRSIAAKFRAAKPDLLIVCAYYNQLPQVLKFVTEQGVLENSELLVGINLPVATRLGLISSNTLDRVTVAAPEYTLRSEVGQELSALARQFRERYRKRFRKEPDYDAAYGYDALMLLADAIRAVGVGPPQVSTHLKSVAEYQGASGKISIGPDGNSSTRWMLGRYDKGKLSLLEPLN